jgi:hypothetical protein
MRSDQANEVAKQLVQLYRSTCLGRRHSVASIWRLQRVSIMCTSKLLKFKFSKGLYVHSVYRPNPHTHIGLKKYKQNTKSTISLLATKATTKIIVIIMKV